VAILAAGGFFLSAALDVSLELSCLLAARGILQGGDVRAAMTRRSRLQVFELIRIMGMTKLSAAAMTCRFHQGGLR
jgi:hypothetical protein